MNSTACTVWLTLIAFLSQTTHPSVAAQPPTEASKIRKGDPEVWKAAIKSHAASRQSIANALMEVALDVRVKNDDRNEAIVQLAEIPSKKVLDFLLKYLALEIQKDWEVSSVDQARRRPCRYALSEIGWPAVPHMLAFLEQKRNNEELVDLAYIFRQFMGREGTIALLTAYQQGAVSPARENLEKILARLKPDKK